MKHDHLRRNSHRGSAIPVRTPTVCGSGRGSCRGAGEVRQAIKTYARTALLQRDAATTGANLGR